eukprot:2621420-Amphidinium_carterae.1
MVEPGEPGGTFTHMVGPWEQWALRAASTCMVPGSCAPCKMSGARRCRSAKSELAIGEPCKKGSF